MASYHSGLLKNEQLLTIRTDDLYLSISGDLDLNRYNQESYKSFIDNNETMHFSCNKAMATVKIYDVKTKQLIEQKPDKSFLPIFFENGRYVLQVKPLKEHMQVQFFHEYEGFRKAVRPVLDTNILSGILHFQNEVGFSSFEIRDEQDNTLLSVVMEVYPTKLDYKEDYRAILKEVSEEIYNLAYDFLKRTFLKGSSVVYHEPTGVEFYRLLEKHYKYYMKAVNFIEQKPHRKLVTNYEEVRGDRLRKQDAVGRAYLRKNTNLFVEVEKGIALNGKQFMPQKGLLIKKIHTYDTHENRYVKMTLERLYNRIENLSKDIKKAKYDLHPDPIIINILDSMKNEISKKLKKPFWKSIGRLDRSVMSVVLQMASGYRDVYQIYATLSKGIILSGEIYKMSIKDIARLYEYWTFLRLGKILKEKCDQISQDIIKVSSNGLVVNLSERSGAQRIFKHKSTGEIIKLQYQYSTGKKEAVTVTQIPDTMLIIEKLGKDYEYKYIFDAKYRINFGNDENSTGPGPMEDDINTMHRYRDAIVAESEGHYERTAFGAYVLFPWSEQDQYTEHHLYKSIEKVNIGGLPFLPNATELVENIIDNLLNKTADELQAEGILPKGTREFLYDDKSDYVLVVPSVDSKELTLRIRKKELPKYWHKAKKIALCTSEGIKNESFIKSIGREDEDIVFQVDGWPSPLNTIQSGSYTLKEPILVEEHVYNGAFTLPELLFTNNVQRQFLKMLKDVSNDIEIELDSKVITRNTKISSFKLHEHIYHWRGNSVIFEQNGEIVKEISINDLEENIFEIFKELAARI